MDSLRETPRTCPLVRRIASHNRHVDQHGPQSSGLLLGRKDSIAAALLNNNPLEDVIGRTCKVGKEEMMGLLVAVEEFLRRFLLHVLPPGFVRIRHFGDWSRRRPSDTAL